MSRIEPRFKLSNVTLAIISSGLIAYSGALYAQEDNQTKEQEKTDNIEVIEVTGFRRSLIQSINQKRFADTVTEQLSADDLGSLPDVSMADALTRLSGVSAVRSGGQAAEINICGMLGCFVAHTSNLSLIHF